MKKLLLVICFILQAQAAVGAIWVRGALTGGSTGAIDAISALDARPNITGSQPLTGKDICITQFGGQIYYHLYDPASTAPESPPAVIAPDDIGGNPGRWLRVPPFLLPADIPGLAAVATSGDYNDLTNKPLTITTAQAAEIVNNAAFVAAPHAPAAAEQNVNADWAAAPGGDDYIINKPVIPSQTSQLTNDSGYLTSYIETDPTAEPALGNPATNGYVLSSTTSGGRSWIAPAADLSTKSTTDLAEGANLYYTEARVSANSDVAANTAARHNHANLTQLDKIDQDLSTTASPTFAGVTINGADGGRALSLLDNTIVVPCLVGDYRLYPQNGIWKRCENGTVTDVGAGAAAGDMLKSIYDANSDNMVDETAIDPSIARDSELPTSLPASDVSAWAKAAIKPSYTAAEVGALPDTATIPTAVSQLTNDIGYLTTETDPTAEPALGNPGTDGYVLSSTVAGVRSWISGGGGSVDLTAPGPIGSVTPDAGAFTNLIADTFDFGAQPAGTTGEIALPEDPANGTNVVSFKAPAAIAVDVILTLPAIDGAVGQVMATDAAGTLSWVDAVLDSDIGTTVQAWDTDLADLADGSLTGSKIGSGISGNNITVGIVSATHIDAAIARDSEVTKAPVAAPAAWTDVCTAGTWAATALYHYDCITNNIVAARLDVSFDAATKTITSLTDPIGTNAVVGHTIGIAGSTANNGIYTVSSITDANNIVVSEVLVDEAAGATVTVQQNEWRRAAMTTW